MDYTKIAEQQAAAKETEFKQSLLLKIDALTSKVESLEKKVDALKAKPSKE